jgi:hypothetical protein
VDDEEKEEEDDDENSPMNSIKEGLYGIMLNKN